MPYQVKILKDALNAQPKSVFWLFSYNYGASSILWREVRDALRAIGRLYSFGHNGKDTFIELDNQVIIKFKPLPPDSNTLRGYNIAGAEFHDIPNIPLDIINTVVTTITPIKGKLYYS